MLDVYHHKERIHCVLEHCHGDLEQLINDKSVVRAHIASGPAYSDMAFPPCCVCQTGRRVAYTAAAASRHQVVHADAAARPGPLPQVFLLAQGEHGFVGCWVLVHALTIDPQYTPGQDLKTNNLMLGDDGQLKLIDFGMARAFGSPHHKLNHQVVTMYVLPVACTFGHSYSNVSRIAVGIEHRSCYLVLESTTLVWTCGLSGECATPPYGCLVALPPVSYLLPAAWLACLQVHHGRANAP